ncbi:tRNA:m(4)X modification enzyme TRM13 homolog isoform X2 [Zerene cesonia]|uniref:tRNA:m(4)X modification enzyme TRM13 homolog isoform X2 n=1 Tax=Zerene cesonia TaxID=33412 RepID=UPI0018E596D3|nr:tRNA:m(4)X modification enzyme TRM13 homolog isoform X2 [Zerene cesonia]
MSRSRGLKKDDTRIPCPNDPKHTCYASKLEKHLAICNARQQERPEYIQQDVNAPPETGPERKPLSQTPLIKIMKLIDKVNYLYEKHIKDEIGTLSERDIHPAVKEEWQTDGRTESSLRHLRQASRLMYLIEEESLVHDNTCYVELGAGKGHLSYFAWQAWCSPPSRSRVLLVERAALRHKRDNKIRDVLLNQASDKPTQHVIDNAVCGHERDNNYKNQVGNKQVNTVRNESELYEKQSSNNNGNTIRDTSSEVKNDEKSNEDMSFRLRADLAHLVLDAVPAVKICDSVVGFAKHLCGVATDYSMRCLTAAGSRGKARGLVLATCCHHRCMRGAYVANQQLQELGIDADDFNVILGVVSWATCGDGRSRDKKLDSSLDAEDRTFNTENLENEVGTKALGLSRDAREEVGRRAKALLDWGRVLYLRGCGFDARLAYYVHNSVSLENVCIIAKKIIKQ